MNTKINFNLEITKKWLLNFSALLLFMLFINPIMAQTPVSKNGRLKVKGNKIVNKNGQAISLAGNSLFWSNAGDVADFYNAATVKKLKKDWNSSIVRAAIGVKESWDGGNGYINKPDLQMKKLEKVIKACLNKGLYVIVDWHTHEMYPAEAKNFFSKVAKK